MPPAVPAPLPVNPCHHLGIRVMLTRSGPLRRAVARRATHQFPFVLIPLRSDVSYPGAGCFPQAGVILFVRSGIWPQFRNRDQMLVLENETTCGLQRILSRTGHVYLVDGV